MALSDDGAANGEGKGPPSTRDRVKAFFGKDTVVRFLKYFVLLFAVGGTLWVTFDCYSYFIARRAIDAELQAKNVLSLENLVVTQRRNRDSVVALYELRCVERDIITLARILDGRRSALRDATSATYQASSDLSQLLKKEGPIVLKSAVVERLTKGTGAEFKVDVADPQVTNKENLKDDPPPTDAQIKALMDQWNKDKAAYQKVADAYAALAKEDESFKLQAASLNTLLQRLEVRVENLKKQTEVDRQRSETISEVLARYDTWTRALAPQEDFERLFNELDAELKGSHTNSQQSLNCDAVGRYQRVLEKMQDDEKAWRNRTFFERLGELGTVYNRMLLRYFEQGPAAQTLFVTLLIGALGALTLNILRLSNVGWWERHDDPDWGEIIIAPFLGALAAFAIYLVGSAGLLLTSDVRNGPSTLSAAFIGLLGFVSGLLYDEAFGRVRRVGQQLFSGDKPDEAAAPRPEDLELTRLLQDNGATLIASLVAKRQLGLRLVAESEFTLIVPSDLALADTKLPWWAEMLDAKKPAFETWFRHHHASKKLLTSAAKTTSTVTMDDGRSFQLTFVGSDLKIGTAEVVKPDLTWQNGVIHITKADLP